MEIFAIVVHSMQALLDEEIDLVKGQVIKITEIIDKDWYRGEIEGKCGVFPSSFVQIINEGSRPPPPPPIVPDRQM